MKSTRIMVPLLGLVAFCLPACDKQHEEHTEPESHTIVLTSPLVEEVTLTRPYVCLIHSKRHIKVKALQAGYLLPIEIGEGQEVQKGQVLFKVNPRLYQARLDAEAAEARLAELELSNTQMLSRDKVVSPNEVALFQAKLAKAVAKKKVAESELYFTEIRAPFDGIIDRLHEQQGSLLKEGDMLTTLSDNSVMWVYFNVPEARYLEYKAGQDKKSKNPQQLKLTDSQIELKLADGSMFDQTAGDVVTVEGQFNNETGNIAFRADFPNPNRMLRHGQTGTVLIKRKVSNALIIPQRATFEVLDKQYVFVVDKDNVVHQRRIHIEHELEDIFILKKGLEAQDRIVLEGVRQVQDGQKLENPDFRKPKDVLAHQKNRAE